MPVFDFPEERQALPGAVDISSHVFNVSIFQGLGRGKPMWALGLGKADPVLAANS
jgi:hypothetical protein